MIRKPHAAFGRILYSNRYEAGDTETLRTTSDSQTVLFCSEGDINMRENETGVVVFDCFPGWIKYGGFNTAVNTVTAHAYSVVWCYDALSNKGYVPPIERVALKSGETIDLPQGTTLFLCVGTLVINGVDHVGPRQISVKSANVTAAATTDVYGLNFK